MICDDLPAKLSEWIEQVDQYLAECTIYDESVREHLIKVRDAMQGLKVYLATGEVSEYLDSLREAEERTLGVSSDE